MRCPTCGSPNPDGSEFCKVCGTKLTKTAQQTGYQQQAGYQQQTGYPQQAGYQQQTGYPQHAGYQQQPGYPQQGGYPQQTGYPQQGGYPHSGRVPYQAYQQNKTFIDIQNYLTQPVMRYVALGLVGFSCLTTWLPWLQISVHGAYIENTLYSFTIDFTIFIISLFSKIITMSIDSDTTIDEVSNSVASTVNMNGIVISICGVIYTLVLTIVVIAIFVSADLVIKNNKKGPYILAGCGFALFLLSIIYLIFISNVMSSIELLLKDYSDEIYSYYLSYSSINTTVWVVLCAITGLLGGLPAIIQLPSIQQKLRRFT